MNVYLPYLGSLIIAGWGIAHIAATKPVVTGFGALSLDNRRVLVMEWVMEGVAFVFIGALVALVTALGRPGDLVTTLVYWVSALALLTMAAISFFTGARTSVLPMRLCPWVKMTVALLFLLGATL
jgi:hypothetical protein